MDGAWPPRLASGLRLQFPSTHPRPRLRGLGKAPGEEAPAPVSAPPGLLLEGSRFGMAGSLGPSHSVILPFCLSLGHCHTAGPLGHHLIQPPHTAVGKLWLREVKCPAQGHTGQSGVHGGRATYHRDLRGGLVPPPGGPSFPWPFLPPSPGPTLCQARASFSHLSPPPLQEQVGCSGDLLAEDTLPTFPRVS